VHVLRLGAQTTTTQVVYLACDAAGQRPIYKRGTLFDTNVELGPRPPSHFLSLLLSAVSDALLCE